MVVHGDDNDKTRIDDNNNDKNNDNYNNDGNNDISMSMTTMKTMSKGSCLGGY